MWCVQGSLSEDRCFDLRTHLRVFRTFLAKKHGSDAEMKPVLFLRDWVPEFLQSSFVAEEEEDSMALFQESMELLLGHAQECTGPSEEQ